MKKNIAFAALRKVFSAAVFAGCVCLNVQAVTLDDFDISGKPVTTPTLDYLRSNHVEIPQKQISGGVLVDGGTPIEAPESAYTISVGSESDYSFMIYTEDETGALVAKYYKVNIDTPQASGGLSWTETASAGPNTVKVSLPNGDRYFAYSYVTPAGYIENTTGGGVLSDSVSDVVFRDISGRAVSYSGATSIDINADFVGNSGYGDGVAIFNNGGTIGNIAGNFIGNHGNNSPGGAIYNYLGIINNITGNFIGNYVDTHCGGAIYNRGTIANITADFISNHAYRGGAISNESATIGNITGDFIGNYASYGGAIYNRGTIGNITGDFIGNYGSHWGGAIHNIAAIGNITGDFIGNYLVNNNISDNNGGGAISNESATIGNITGDFIGNYILGRSDISDFIFGGAISNFTQNALGSSIVEDIRGDFTGNYVDAMGASYQIAAGGAISNLLYLSEGNDVKIGNIYGDFTNNYAKNPTGYAFGGAIINGSDSAQSGASIVSIDSITGDFTGNRAEGAVVAGGAIANCSQNSDSSASVTVKIGDIKGDFTANSLTGVYRAMGGAIANISFDGKDDVINSISGDFANNSITMTAGSSGDAFGGAIANVRGKINGDITGDFTGNSISHNGTSGNVAGGAIYNTYGTIGNITGNFIGNYVTSNADAISAYGGAIESAFGDIDGNITGDFIGNYVAATGNSGLAGGGAICNGGSIGSNATGIVNSNFRNNYAKGTMAMGGAIYAGDCYLTIQADNGTSEFTGNYVENLSGDRDYQAIYMESATLTLDAVNNGTITFNDNINGANYLVNVTGDSTGKVILNNEVKNTTVTLTDTTMHIGVTDSVNNESSVMKSSDLVVTSGTVDTVDGAYTNYTIKSLDSSENARYSIDVVLENDELKADTFTLTEDSTGKIYISNLNITNDCDDDESYIVQIIKSETGSAPQLDYNNSSVLHGATSNMASDTIIAKEFGLYTTNTTNDSIMVRGAQNALAAWAALDTAEDKSFTFVDSSAYVLTKDARLLGNNITISGSNNTLDVQNHEFLDNITAAQNVTLKDLAIENSNSITNNGTITLDSVKISADITNNSDLNVKSNTTLGNINNTSQVKFDNATATVNGNLTGSGTVTLENSEAGFTGDVTGQNITAENSTLNITNAAGFLNNSMSLNGGAFNVGTVGLSGLSFDNLALTNGAEININSVDVDLANEVMGTVSANTYTDVSTGKININGLNLTSSTDKSTVDIPFADSTIAGIVSYNGASTVAYSPIYKYNVLYNSENGNFNFARTGSSNNPTSFNPAVLNGSVAVQTGTFAAMNETLNMSFRHMDHGFMNYPLSRRTMANKYAVVDNLYSRYDNLNGKNTWYQPYVSFENAHLAHGPNVDVVNYGALFGGDSEITDLRRGWKTVTTAFAGYNGSNMHYSSVHTYQNGGVLGVTQSFYKNNFFTGLTVSAGASVGESDTMYGRDTFTSLMAGVASKTGYNFEFKEGKFILQPSLMMAYSFINTFDYTNAAGVKMESDPLHTIQLHPTLKFITNIGSWQPYASVGMVWNIMNDTKFTANDLRLPSMSVRPYVEYGLGIQKFWDDRYSGFLQAMVRNGGRNGIALTFGFKVKLGKTKTEQVKNPSAPKMVLKSRV